MSDGTSPDVVSDGSFASKTFRVLALDGGGAKGFYTLGALKEIEGLVACPLCQKFDLIYGTSTGAIIAALLGLGKSVDDIEKLYRDHVVTVMARWLPCRKSAALEALAALVFGERKFDAFKTEMGIVGTRWSEDRPIIFKTNRRQAFLGAATFQPGFGCTIADAVVGSCSAYPFFKKKFVKTGGGENLEVRDGGFVANNPTLFAIVDATESLGHARKDVRVVSIGVGEYPPPKLMISRIERHAVWRQKCQSARRPGWVAALLQSFPDASSPLTGAQLVIAKVLEIGAQRAVANPPTSVVGTADPSASASASANSRRKPPMLGQFHSVEI